MLRWVVTLVLATHVLPHAPLRVESSVAAADATAGLFAARGGSDVPRFTLTGDQDGGDGAFDLELDLDPDSKRKLQRLQQGSDRIELTLNANGDHVGRTMDWTTKVRPHSFNYGRGAAYVTTEAVDKGDVLFSLRFSEIMSLQSARMGRIKAMLDANPTLPPAISLALHLLEEKFRGEASRFHSFIEALPTTSDLNSTTFYGESDLERLEGSQLLRLTMGRRKAITTFFEVLVTPVTSLAVDPPLFAKHEFTLEHFEWAMGVVWSHAFQVNDREEDVVIAPILSTIGVCTNEYCPPNRIEWDQQTQRLVVYATQDYAAGEEVRLNVGPRSTALLMLNHGLAPPKPVKLLDTYEISIMLDPQDALLSVKSLLLESINMTLNSTYTLRYKAETLDTAMIHSLKIKLLTGVELDKYRELINGTRPIVSLRNEFVYTRAVVMTCKNLLEQYPTTLEQDQAWLDVYDDHTNAHIADRQVHITRAMVAEKKMLHHAMDLVTKQWTDLLLTSDPAMMQ